MTLGYQKIAFAFGVPFGFPKRESVALARHYRTWKINVTITKRIVVITVLILDQRGSQK
jgi:hypothetical protein